MSQLPDAPTPPLTTVGLVAIGRNEGERLKACLRSVPDGLERVVYVDSGSDDDSVAWSRQSGVECVELDMSIPFTAARARNAGMARLREKWPSTQFVQVVDGDCILVTGWIEAALEKMAATPDIAVVCGRRREIHPEASVYNRLCDMEWDTPVGEVDSCGGDALLRLQAIEETGGYDESVIAGEEPELCFRLRARGWKIHRIDHEMTLHDASMSRASQWWQRAVRAGHAYAEAYAMHPPFRRRELRSILLGGGLIPVGALALAWPTRGLSLLLLGVPLAQFVRAARGQQRQGYPTRDAVLFGLSCTLAKMPQLQGAAKFWWSRTTGKRNAIIEYKGSAPA